VAGEKGFADGPGKAARFHTPEGLAISPAGDLVVADAENHRLRLVSLHDGAYTVQTILGTGETSDADAPHARDAQANLPGGLAFAPDGTLYSVNFAAASIRTIAAPVGPDAPTRFMAGPGQRNNGTGTGFWANAPLSFPLVPAWDPRGWLVIGTRAFNYVLAVTPASDA